MKRLRDQAYVLRTHPLGDADLIVALLTEQHGLVRGVARSARRSRRRFGGVLEPLTHVRAEWFEREGRDLGRIEALESIRSFAGMQARPELQALCAGLAEVAGTFTHEGQDDPRGFRLLGAVLEALEADRDPWALLRYFEYWTLRLHGLLPDPAECARCGQPADRVVEGGQPSCGACTSSGTVLTRADVEFLRQLRRAAPRDLPEDALSARPGGAVESLLRGALEGFAERRFRSYRHVRAAMENRAGRGEGE